MNQVIFANEHNIPTKRTGASFEISLVPISDFAGLAGDLITDKPNEDFVIEYVTPSKTVKTIEVNRETLNIQKINDFDYDMGEYYYNITAISDLGENPAVQIIKQNAVPHQRNSWYIELDGTDAPTAEASFFNQLKVLIKSNLLGITSLNIDTNFITSNNPLVFKGINCTVTYTANVLKTPYQYIKSLLEKNVQNLGYNHTDDNFELNSGLADYKAWMSGTESDENVVVYRLRFATNRKASKTRDERVWQNVYICCKGEENPVSTLLESYIAILNGEGGE